MNRDGNRSIFEGKPLVSKSNKKAPDFKRMYIKFEISFCEIDRKEATTQEGKAEMLNCTGLSFEGSQFRGILSIYTELTNKRLSNF